MDNINDRLIFKGASEGRIKGVFNRGIDELKKSEEPTCWFNPTPVTLESIIESAQNFSTGFVGKLSYKIKCQLSDLDPEEQLDLRTRSTKEICYDICSCLLAMEDWSRDWSDTLGVSTGEGMLHIEALDQYRAKISKPSLRNDGDTVSTIVYRSEFLKIIAHLKPFASHFRQD